MPIILDGTAGVTNNATDLNYTGTLTGGTGVVNLGSGQVVKDASGNVGIGTTNLTGTFNVKAGTDQKLSVSPGAVYGGADGTALISVNEANTVYRDFVIAGKNIVLNATGGTSNVGIGTSSPGAKLDVNGAALIQGLTVGRGGGAISTNTASGYQALYSNTLGSSNTASGYQALYSNTTGSGNTAINPLNSAGSYVPVFNPTTENNRFCMGSTGVTNAYIQVAWTVVSDARDKTDFAPVPHGLAFVTQLQPTAYRYKMNRSDTEGHGPLRYGFKAQEVLALEGDTPVIVDAEDSAKLRFNDQAMIAVLVNAVKELKAEFDLYKSTHP